MNKRILTAIALTLALVMSLSSCSFLSNLWESYVSPIFKGPTVELTDAPLNAKELINFKDGANKDVLFESDGWSNGDVFNVVWKSHNVVYENGIMRLGITEENATAYLDSTEVTFNYTAGEARTQNYYHYGDYEVSMKPSANPGTASTFFVCTGPYDVKNGTPNAHDEIDIEFLGKDTTKVQFNFFVDGKGGNEYMYDLGFDASKEFHRYGFRWAEDSITWFVDGKPVYKVTTDKNATEASNIRIVEKLPSTAGRILSNYWCGNERAWGWMGEYKGAVNDNGTEYQWIATSAVGAPLNPPAENPDNGENGDPVTPPAGTDDLQFNFWISDATYYVVDGNNIKYNGNGKTYACVGADIATIATGKDTFTVTITNNGEANARVRFDIQATNKIGNHDACNVSAVGGDVWTDTTWGGSIVTVPAGEEVTIAITYDENSDRGALKNLVVFVDSCRGDENNYTADITLSGMTFSKVGTSEPTDPVDPPTDPVDPPTDPVDPPVLPELPNDGEYVKFETKDAYTIIADGEYVNKVQITYSAISTNTWHNVSTYIADKAAGKATLTLTLRNNTTTPALVSVKLENASATELAFQKVELAAGELKTVSLDFSGEAQMLYFFIDSDWSETTTTHAGDISIAGIKFSGEATPTDPVDPPVDPEPQPEYTYSDLYVEFKTENAYTLTSENQYSNNVNVTYTDIAQNSWNNINIWVADKSADCTRFSMKLTNNGSAQVSVWVQMKDEAGAELINQNVNIAAGATEVFTFDYTGTAQMIFFFVDSTHEAAAGPNAGDITISEIKLGKVAATEEPAPDPAPALPNDGEYVKFEGDAEYISNPQDYANVIGITYSGVNKDSYKCINTWIQDKATGKTIVTFAVRNNGTETVGIMVKVQTTTETVNGEGAFTIEAGETKTFTLRYTDTPDQLYLFIDSAWNATEGTHSGDITIAGIYFQ